MGSPKCIEVMGKGACALADIRLREMRWTSNVCGKN